MTTDDVIEILNNERTPFVGRAIYTDGERREAFDIAIAALRAQQERENPKPLTLDQLREMDGEPVYLDVDVWALVKYDVGDPLFVFNEGGPCDAKLWYEQIGPAYRQKPKEG